MKNIRITKRISSIFRPPSNGKKVVRIKASLLVLNVIVSFAIVYLLVFINLPLNIPKIEVGKPSPTTIVTSKTVSYVDNVRTEELYEKIKSSVKPVYRLDVESQNLSINSVKGFFNKVKEISASEEMEFPRANSISKELEIEYDLALILAKESSESLDAISNYTVALINRLYINGVRSDSVDSTLNNTYEEINSTNYSNEEKKVIKYILGKYLMPNLLFDSNQTEKAINDALKNVPPIKITLETGTTVITKGEIVTEEHIEILKQMGLLGSRETLRRLIICLLFSLIYSLLTFYAIVQYAERYKKSYIKKFFEYLLILILTFVFIYATKSISLYIFPLPLFAFMIYAFTSLNVTLFLSICFAFLVSIGLEVPYFVLLPILVSILYTLLTFRKASKIISYLYGGMLGSLIFVASITAYGLYSRLTFSEILIRSGYGFANFFIYTIVSLGMIFIFEHLFNEITIVRLLELSNTDNPILKELLEKAPGTYQHSMLVASITSAAAEAIGANALLAKVGAYYHDIGKIVNPIYFTENQNGAINIHNSISPFLSKSILVNHVKDGVAIAKRFRLPQEIIDFIETHHGKNVISYFYQKAKDIDPAVNKEDFRYPGKLPKSKETAILLLADAVEAASHSLESIDYRKIDELVRTLVDERIADGQLADSELTFSDMSKIRESFVKSLLSIYHRREKYPNGKEKE